MKYPVIFLLLFTALTATAGNTGDSLSIVKKHSAWFDLKDKYHEHRVYIYWGYNRDYYLKSDIYIHGPGYNFVIYNTAALDKQARFSAQEYFGITTLSEPQYNYRAGFYIKHNIHISIGLDHMKYVVVQNQTVKMTGTIDSSVSTQYAGTYNNKSVVLTPDFIRLQHTNGLNVATIDVGWLMPICHSKHDIFHLGWNFGAGGFIVVTRTEFHFMNVFYYNPFHVSGIAFPVLTGPRIDLWKFLFFAAEAKSGEVFLPWAPAENTPQSGIHQRIGYLEYYIVGGLSFPVDKKAWPMIKRKSKLPYNPSVF